MIRAPRLIFSFLVVLGLGACAPSLNLDPVLPPDPDTVPQKGVTFSAVPFEAVQGWRTGDVRAVIDVFLRSCERIRRRAPDAPFGNDPRTGTVGDWIGICDDAALQRSGSVQALYYFLESRFQAYQIREGGNPSGLFTGYFEAELRGSWEPGGAYTVPLLTRPDDLIPANLGSFREEWAGSNIAGRLVDGRYVPYYTRAEITAGALQGRGLELIWVDNAIDAFFLHIQGSGRVALPNGTYVRVGYAGRNGHRYVPVGRELIGMGALTRETVSMQSIRAWMEQNPLAAQELMNRNPSYIFFRVLDETAPVGAQGVPLTPERSMAVDTRYVPLGTMVWLVTRDPRDEKRKTPYERFMVAQDRGSAIKGGVRGDVFWGAGAEAAFAAGQMKEPGGYYVLFPKSAAGAVIPDQTGF